MNTADMIAHDPEERRVLKWHLLSNHYPPVPLSMLGPCITAINLAIDGEWNAIVRLPADMTYRGEHVATVLVIVEAFHLMPFVENGEPV